MSNAIDGIKVFISYASNDVQLACQLKSVLKMNGIQSYLFDLNQQYDSTLHDKITNAINNAHALIAIITKGCNSMSVHEEIGYAFGKERTVIIMIEKDAKDAVLSHERDQERFTKETFDDSCERILRYLQAGISAQTPPIASTKFLQERNLLDINATNFCSNPNSDNITKSITGTKTTADPVVLFSSCPTKLLNIPVTTEECSEWLERFSSIPVNGRSIRFLRGYRQIGLDQVTYYYNSRTNYNSYIELVSNGFIEQGCTIPLISTENLDSIGKKTVLRANWTSGTFWAFLIFMKEYYLNYGHTNKIDIFFSIRDAQELMLMSFGNRWPEPYKIDWDVSLPHTELPHIQLRKTIETNAMTKEWIETTVKEFANKIANAYGLESNLCFEPDGLLDMNLLSFHH